MSSIIAVQGLQELREAMLQLPKRLDRRVLNAALMAAGRLVAKEAESRAPVLQKPDPRRRAGTVRRNIRAAPVRATAGNSATVYVRVRKISAARQSAFRLSQFKRGKKAGGANNPNDPYYWRFLEFGTSKMAARPFLRPALAAKTQEAIAAFQLRMAERLIVEAQRLNKGPKR